MIDTLPKDDPRLERILITSDEIAARVDALAKDIRRAYADAKDLCIIGVLNGATVFMTDLARALCRAGMPGITMKFIRASTYGDTIKENGEKTRQVKIEMPGSKVLLSNNILLVDDVLDQGYTLSAIRQRLLDDYPGCNVRTCVLLVKNLVNPNAEAAKLRRHFNADHVGFEVEDRWVVGYGLDAKELYRELPYVAIAKEEFFI
ncbi:MAG: hypothetical protein J5833_02635 [Victivallales bacterium]|nr:hypothetical protein [Victivallales bacterium]